MSPYKLLQEIYINDHWKMMVCCILLNRTRRIQVDWIRDTLFEYYPTAFHLQNADPEIVAEILRPLGLYNRRAKSLIRFSKEWVSREWKDVSELHGIGQYAQDSYDIFVKKKRRIKPDDHRLNDFVAFMHHMAYVF